MFVTVGSRAVKLNAASSRIPFSKTRAAGRVQCPPSIHKRGTDHARQENTDVDR